MKELIIHPRSGLASRMRAVASGKYVADYFGADFKIIWQPNNECNCRFTDLFNPTVKNVDMDYPTNLHETKMYFKDSLRLEKSELSNPRHSGANAYVFPRNIALDDDYVYMQTNAKIHPEFSEPYEFSRQYYLNLKELFVPNDAVKLRLVELPTDIMGVHIRRGNPEDTTRNSIKMRRKVPDEVFASRMRKALKNKETCGFYLATDSAVTRERLVKEFGESIITRNISERRSVDGVIDAFVDIILLSRTKKILGSGWSAFGVVAADFGDKPLELFG